MRAAEEWAGHLSLKVYHQADPRGCSVYLVPLNFDGNDYTAQGMPISD